MIYLYVARNSIKVFGFKKSFVGASEVYWASKSYKTNLETPDLIASATKEILNQIQHKASGDKEVVLIVPGHIVKYYRLDLEPDEKPKSIKSYAQDKVKEKYKVNLANVGFDAVHSTVGDMNEILVYTLDDEYQELYTKPLMLLDLKIMAIVPDTAAYYALFDKTLSATKKENILYATYEDDALTGYAYDSVGPLDDGQPWHLKDVTESNVELALHQKANEYEIAGHKLNRLILSGAQSEKVRQDTFTKNVGVWTNPLKRIVPNFYQDYMRHLPEDFPLLTYDACLATYVLRQEQKDFSIYKPSKKKYQAAKPTSNSPTSTAGFSSSSRRKKKSSWPQILTFIVVFALVFGGLIAGYTFIPKDTWANLSFTDVSALAKLNPLNIIKPAPTLTPTPSPTPAPPTPTPTPAFKKSDIKLKIQNGTGAAGKASVYRNIFAQKGYENILTENAQNFGYTVSEVLIKKDKMYLKETILADFKDSSPTPTVTVLESDSAADVIIILGADTP